MNAIQPILTGVVNELSVRGQAMCALIRKNVGIQTKFGMRTIGDFPELALPVLFVHPNDYVPDLATTGKFHIELSFVLMWYVDDSNPEDCLAYCTSIGHNLEKLFSNNALNDLGTASPPSHNFYEYDPYWVDVMNFSFKPSPLFRNPFPNQGGDFMCAGKGSIKVRTMLIR